MDTCKKYKGPWFAYEPKTSLKKYYVVKIYNVVGG